MLEKLEKIKKEDPKTYEKIITSAKWAALIVVAVIIVICVVNYLK